MIEIRNMEIDDIEAVIEMDTAIFPDPWSETGLFTYLIREDTVFLTAWADNALAGYCGAQTAADEADIITVAVSETMRGKGLGKQLLSELIGKVQEKGAENIYLEVRVGNEPAKALYRSAGFTENGIRKNYYSDPKEDALNMRYTGSSKTDKMP